MGRREHYLIHLSSLNVKDTARNALTQEKSLKLFDAFLDLLKLES